VFEDLHWADAESLALFGRLAVTADLPLLLVGTFRPEGVARRHPLVELLAELERQRLVTGVALERLSRAGVAELLAAVYGNPVPYQVAEALHRRTGGNPFFLEELVVTAGRVDPARLATLPLPWNLSEAVLRRLDDLAPASAGWSTPPPSWAGVSPSTCWPPSPAAARTSSSPSCATWWPRT
jgi:hypothetical protein